MTIEVIFAVVQAVVTGILGAILKHRVVPSNLIPIQNMVIGVVSALVAIYFGIFNNIPTAIITCLAISLGVGGGYDLVKAPNKQEGKE